MSISRLTRNLDKEFNDRDKDWQAYYGDTAKEKPLLILYPDNTPEGFELLLNRLSRKYKVSIYENGEFGYRKLENAKAFLQVLYNTFPKYVKPTRWGGRRCFIVEQPDWRPKGYKGS